MGWQTGVNNMYICTGMIKEWFNSKLTVYLMSIQTTPNTHTKNRIKRVLNSEIVDYIIINSDGSVQRI